MRLHKKVPKLQRSITRLFALMVFCFLIAITAYGQQKPKKKIRLPGQLEEVSGLYYVSQDSMWWHNDSGDAPKLYLTNDEGFLLATVEVPMSQHIDWEDITYDNEGWLYIGDFGNNRNNRKRLVIYKFQPASQKVDSISYTYENQSNPGISFNVEGFFCLKDSLYLFTKDRLPESQFITRQYALAKTGQQQVAVLQDSLTLKKRVVTGAAIHHPSGTVALLSYYYKKWLGIFPCSSASVFFFKEYPGNHFFSGKLKRKRISGLVATQFESIDFVNERFFYVASEKTAFIKPKAKRKRWKYH